MRIKRILHMDSDIPSVYFPIGKLIDEGTCEFSTYKCIEYCPSGQVINKHERYTLTYFKNYLPINIFKKLFSDFKYLAAIPYNAKMIQWFAWGDCLSELTEKVAQIILMVQDEKIPQYGFTRNKRLWKILPSTDILNIGLSVDDLTQAKKMSIESGKMISHPDYESGYAEMIFSGEIVTRCNGWWCITNEETRNSDCTKCLTESTGCYSQPFV